MKKRDIRNIILGIAIGTVGITTVFANNGIKYADFNNTTVSLDGTSIPLNNRLVNIQKDNEEDAQLYIPARELLEYLGYSVNLDEAKNNVDLVSEINDLTKMQETITNESYNSGKKMQIYYDNDSEIAKESTNMYSYSYKSMGGETSFNLFTGCNSLYEFDMEESADLTIKFQSNIIQGKFKLVLVNPDGEVIIVSETVTPDNIDIEKTISLPQGKNILKIVGLNTSGDFKLSLSGDEVLAHANAQSLGK